jgi:hypothetical protein
MALINKTPFVLGTIFTPEVATEMAGVTFDDQPQYYGHFNRIADADLSNAAGAIKQRVSGLSTNLLVSAGAGLTVTYTAGKALFGSTVYNIGAASLAVAANTTSLVYVTKTGAVVSVPMTAPPAVIRAGLAVVVTNGSGITSVVDVREGFNKEVIKPYTASVKSFGGLGEEGDYNAVNGDVISGDRYYNNFYVPAGITITVSRFANIFCSGVVEINGTITVTSSTLGGCALNVVGVRSFPGAEGSGQGGGKPFDQGIPYSYRLSPVGSGGGGGSIRTDANNFNNYTTASGGNGGGGLIIEAAGYIFVSNTGIVTAVGSVGGTAGVSATGATAGNVAAIGGGGGGSGGLIFFKSLVDITVQGNLNVSGGAGGAAPPNNTTARSGAPGLGGGGGYIQLYSPSVNTTGSNLNVSGGAAGGVQASFNTTDVVQAIGGCGGSYAGLGGDYLANATMVPSTAGTVIVRSFAAVSS